MNQGFERWLPAGVAGVAALYLLFTMTPPADPEGGMELERFKELLVVDGGRFKPVDTFARTELMIVSGRQVLRDTDRKTHPAVVWLLDNMVRGLAAYHASRPDRRATAETIHAGLARRRVDEAPVFWIDDEAVLGMIGLPRRDIPRYSSTELLEAPGYKEFRERAQSLVEKAQTDRQGLGQLETRMAEVELHLQRADRITFLSGALMVPPARGVEEDWETLARALISADGGVSSNALARSWETILVAYGTGDVRGFNQAVAAHQAALAQRYPAEVGLAKVEVWFNDFAPFYQCTILYVVVFLLACLSWGPAWAEPLRRAAFWLAALTFAVHTLALCLRMYIQGRPPITNLYSSAVFIGWFCLLLCLVLEATFKNTVGSVVAAALGFATMIIAMHLGGSGDTLEMMQAVLDTNFWLATHVTTINIGYAATFVAGFIAIVYILRGLFTTSLDKGMAKSLGQMMYGVICFATLLSFVGTVLGGIWADQSWGRFWGWDPKENGALLIVIMNALILHARWGGLVKERGMAVLALCGNTITAWSWFGTNQLGIGLHAYGFNTTLAVGCRWFWLSQLLLIGAGLIPLRYWRNFRAPVPARSGATRSMKKGSGAPAIAPAS
jgi:ABC-type transport system involved in cytochrome c biogenesis permease subunit